MTPADFKSFLDGYIVCALWSSSDTDDEKGGDSLYGKYDATDLAIDTLAEMTADCERFAAENAEDLASAIAAYGKEDSAGYAGHDFWLTRNGHGAGFWDGDLPEELGERLTKAAEAFGEVNLYVEDGKIITD